MYDFSLIKEIKNQISKDMNKETWPLPHNLFKVFDLNFGTFKDTFEGLHKYSDDISLPVSEYIDESKDYVLEIAAAGVPKENIDIELNGNDLLVYIKERKEVSSKKYLSKKVSSREFKMSRFIPDNYDVSKVQCTFENGLLKIIIPPCKEKENKSIKIEVK